MHRLFKERGGEMTRWVDLHIHTTASDGTQTPEEVMLELIEKEIKVFAITDHDSVEHVALMKQLASKQAVTYIPGVEVSVSYGTQELHILVYGVDPEAPRLAEILEKNQAIREAHNLKLIRYVGSKYSEITEAGYHDFVRNPKHGGWKALNYLMEMGNIKSLHALFETIAEMNTPLIFMPHDEVMPKLKALGYTLILAHPPQYFGGERLSEAFLNDLVELGLDGIECYSPYYNDEADRSYYLAYCERKGLMITSGSDYHGSFIQSRLLGVPQTDISKIKFSFI